MVYDRLSVRMRDRFDIFYQLPDVLDDEWIDTEEKLETELRKFAGRRRDVSAFDVRRGGAATGQGARAEQVAWQVWWKSYQGPGT